MAPVGLRPQATLLWVYPGAPMPEILRIVLVLAVRPAADPSPARSVAVVADHALFGRDQDDESASLKGARASGRLIGTNSSVRVGSHRPFQGALTGSKCNGNCFSWTNPGTWPNIFTRFHYYA